MHWKSCKIAVGAAMFLLSLLPSIKAKGQIEFLAPAFGKEMLYSVEVTSPMGGSTLYLKCSSEKRGSRILCNTAFYEDSLFTRELTSSTIIYLDSADSYWVAARDILAFVMPNITDLEQVSPGGVVAYPKEMEVGQRYEGDSVTLKGVMDQLALTIELNLGETVLHRAEKVEIRGKEYHAFKVTNASEITLLSSKQRLYFTIWYQKGVAPLLYKVSTMEGLMTVTISLID